MHLLRSEKVQEVQEGQILDECVQPGKLVEKIITIEIDLLGFGQDNILQFVDTEGSTDDAVAVVYVKALKPMSSNREIQGRVSKRN